MADTEPRDILIQAIAVKWAATVTLTGAMSGPYRGDKPANTAENPASGTHFPYCVIPEDDSQVFTSSVGSDYYEHTLRFRVYHTSFAGVAALAKLINDVFNSKTLTLSLSAGALVKSRRRRVKYVKESEGVHYLEQTYEFHTSYPITA